jgi:hypothetical protein
VTSSKLNSVPPFFSNQEVNMGVYGAMCPLLDILNHDPSRDWLDLVVNPSDENLLDVKTNNEIERGAEIYYNYGSLSNEQLLYGYGYAVKDNPHDAVAVKMMATVNKGASTESRLGEIGNSVAGGMDSSKTGARHVGTYYVRGGGFEGIPQVCSNYLDTPTLYV